MKRACGVVEIVVGVGVAALGLGFVSAAFECGDVVTGLVMGVLGLACGRGAWSCFTGTTTSGPKY